MFTKRWIKFSLTLFGIKIMFGLDKKKKDNQDDKPNQG